MREIQIGRVYRHFKGDYYLVEAVARDSETEQPVVIYRKLYADGGLWVRPLSMFLSRVDREKYPDVQQEYRFELQEIASVAGHFIVELSRAVVALRQIRHGVNRRSGRAELRVIAKQVHIAFEVLFFFLHRGEQLQCGARIVDGAVGVLCFELIGVHGVAELMRKRTAVLVDRERIQHLRAL